VTVALERVSVQDITEQAKQVRIGQVLLTVFAAVLFAVGWIPAKLCLAVVWACLAVKVGWQDAWTSSKDRPNPTG
jgi:hypothetical protein